MTFVAEDEVIPTLAAVRAAEAKKPGGQGGGQAGNKVLAGREGRRGAGWGAVSFHEAACPCNIVGTCLLLTCLFLHLVCTAAQGTW
jgi:hypothetical protein